MPAYTTTMQTSVTKNGHTWNFTTARPVWFDPNGQPCVLRPVTIASYTPALQGTGISTRNGAMINPVPGTGADPLTRFKQGWTGDVPDGTFEYDPALNYGLTPNYLVPKQAVLINTTYDGSRWEPEKTLFRSMAFLSALDVVPEEGTFAPFYAGDTLKTVPSTWNENLIHYENFANKPIPSPLPAGWPTFADVIAKLTRRQLDLIPTASTGGIVAQGDDTLFYKLTYGEDIGAVFGNAAILLNHNYTNAEKLPLMRLVAMHGMDRYGLYLEGANWFSLGGHNLAKKFALFLTAAMFDDAGMKAALNGSFGIFNEDKTHFFINSTHRLTEKALVNYSGVSPVDPRYQIPLRYMTYSPEQEGVGDWCQEAYDPSLTTPQMTIDDAAGGGIGLPVWNYYGIRSLALYRQAAAGTDLPMVWAAQIMGYRTIFNNEAYFSYVFNRVVPVFLPGFGLPFTLLWARDMVQPETVTSNKPAGSYEPGTQFTVSTPTVGAVIHYKSDGSIPDASSPQVSGPITMASATYKFIPISPGLPPGIITTIIYSLIGNGTPATPTAQRGSPV